VWLSKMQDPLAGAEVQKKYGDFDPEKKLKHF
jgi:hypothetical protein